MQNEENNLFLGMNIIKQHVLPATASAFRACHCDGRTGGQLTRAIRVKLARARRHSGALIVSIRFTN